MGSQTLIGLVTLTLHTQPLGMCSLPTTVQSAGLANDNPWLPCPLPSQSILDYPSLVNTSHGSVHSLQNSVTLRSCPLTWAMTTWLRSFLAKILSSALAPNISNAS